MSVVPKIHRSATYVHKRAHTCVTHTQVCVFKLSNVVKCVRKLCVSKYPVNWPPQPSAEAEAVHRANSADFVSFKQTKSSLGRHSLSENRTLYHAPFPRSSKLNTSWVKSHIMLKQKLCKFPTQNYKTCIVSGHPKTCTRKANLII